MGMVLVSESLWTLDNFGQSCSVNFDCLRFTFVSWSYQFQSYVYDAACLGVDYHKICLFSSISLMSIAVCSSGAVSEDLLHLLVTQLVLRLLAALVEYPSPADIRDPLWGFNQFRHWFFF